MAVKKMKIKFTFYCKRTPHKRKTLFILNYFSSSVGAKEWVTGEAPTGATGAERGKPRKAMTRVMQPHP